MSPRGAVTFILALAIIATAAACGPDEKDCWRGYKYDEDKEEFVKDKLYCDDCCKVCGSNSKACGDTCISESYQCHTGYGCACDRL